MVRGLLFWAWRLIVQEDSSLVIEFGAGRMASVELWVSAFHLLAS
jgi:hypothetical protein